MAIRLNEKSHVLVELPMLLFLRIADGDGKMTAREMERFDALLAKREWCRSKVLKQSLANTEAGKAELWREYVAGDFRVTIDRAAADLDTVFGSAPPEEREGLERDLEYFCGELLKAARAGPGFLGVDAAAAREKVALAELIHRPSTRAAMQATARSESGVAAAAASASSPLRLFDDFNADMIWRRGKLRLRCVHIVEETPDVKTFHFVAEPPKWFVYRPGQFLTLELRLDGKTLRRSYTISSSPSRPHMLSFTVKRVERGLVSNWLHDELRVGDSVFADGPNGKFGFTGEEAGPYLFISGGSGITPVMAMSRWLHDTAPDADIRFLHFARTPKDLVFEHELRVMETRMPGFRCAFVCTRAVAGQGWTGSTGHVSLDLLRSLIPDFESRRIYLCGPVPFMSTTREILEDAGFDMSRFSQESFGGAPRPAKPMDAGASAPAKVTFSASKIVVNCRTTDYLLDVALDNAIDVSFSCRAGQCGTCKATLLEGLVEQDNTDALSGKDVKSGVILLCQSRPKGDVVLDH
jgi:ferredoxin-NADP reductase